MSHKQYWAVWVFHVRGDTGEEGWIHHGSYDTASDAQDEARSLRNGGEKTQLRRQDW